MIDKTTFFTDRLDFTENNKAQIREFLLVIVLCLITLSSALNGEMTTNKTITITGTSIVIIMITTLFVIRDFGKVTFIDEIKQIKLKVNLMGSFIIKIKNTKGKVRVINLGKNHMEVSKYLDFAKRNKIQLAFDKKQIEKNMNI